MATIPPTNSNPDKTNPDLQLITEQIEQLAKSYEGDAHQLLSLLRLLEKLHRQIREDLFQASLPANRNALYSLLRQIEREGGWPMIPAIPLRDLLAHLEAAEQEQ
jgi:hypothetical protein